MITDRIGLHSVLLPFKVDRPQTTVVAKNLSVLQLFISRMPKMCAILQLVSAPLNPTVLQLFISRMPKMCAILQLVSAPLNPITITNCTVAHVMRL